MYHCHLIKHDKFLCGHDHSVHGAPCSGDLLLWSCWSNGNVCTTFQSDVDEQDHLIPRDLCISPQSLPLLERKRCYTNSSLTRSAQFHIYSLFRSCSTDALEQNSFRPQVCLTFLL